MTFMLVHGGGLDSSCWELLVPFLDGLVFAVDLPGRGARPADLSTVTVADFVDAVVSEILDRDLTDVLLVGHSLAGITLPGVAARVSGRLRRLVFVSCVIPAHGANVADVLDTLSPAVAEVTAKIGDDVVGADGTLHPDLAATMFCNDMDEAQRAFTLARLVPESMAVIAEPVDLAGLRMSIPRTYVRLLQDASLVLASQDRMAAKLGDVQIVDVDAGHMAMISQPVELARALNQLSAQVCQTHRSGWSVEDERRSAAKR
jgi:pimeloyl-ACP methyl ester carboxylesterase